MVGAPLLGIVVSGEWSSGLISKDGSGGWIPVARELRTSSSTSSLFLRNTSVSNAPNQLRSSGGPPPSAGNDGIAGCSHQSDQSASFYI